MAIERALFSVSDKSGLAEFAGRLADRNVEFLSTGNTARALRSEGLAVRDVSDVTGFPEILDGRVKTLHPMIHGGLLARGDVPEHLETLNRHGIGRIDLVVSNLYPFARTVEREDVSLEEAIENIDIGGPTLLRAAAKNFARITVVCDPADYPGVAEEIERHGGDTTLETRFELARKVFRHTAEYDGMIRDYLLKRARL